MSEIYEKAELLGKLEDGWEFHYAPIAGGLVLMKGEDLCRAQSWQDFNELLGRFISLRSAGAIEYSRSVTYGHPLHQGHQGQVDVYSLTSANLK